MKWQGNSLVLLQVVGIVLTFLGYGLSDSPIGVPLILCSGAGLVLGVLTLFYNRPGNFSVHPTPLAHSSLITSGPYRYVRHPMYTSVILVLLGLALAAGNTWSWIGLGMGTAAVIGKTYMEEAYLLEKHSEYRTYKQKVKRLIPLIW